VVRDRRIAGLLPGEAGDRAGALGPIALAVTGDLTVARLVFGLGGSLIELTGSTVPIAARAVLGRAPEGEPTCASA
jgi:hypothetical protein